MAAKRIFKPVLENGETYYTNPVSNEKYTKQQMEDRFFKDPNMEQKNAVARGLGYESYEEFKNMGQPKTETKLPNGQIIKDGEVRLNPEGKPYKWDANYMGGSWVDANPDSPEAKKAVQDFAAKNNPANSSAVNAGANERLTALDSNIVPYIQLGITDPVTGKNSYNEERAKAIAESNKPTGMDAQNAAAEMIKKTAGASALEQQFQKYLSENVSNKGVADYGNNLYGRAMTEFERAAQLDRERNAADLASRGLGMSTVVNDVNSAVDRDLATNRQKSFYDSNTAAQNYIAQLMQQGIGMENNIGNRGIASGEALSGVGINQSNIYNNAQNRLNGINQQSENNALLNYGLQNAQHDKNVANVKYLLNMPYATNETGNQASANATSASNAQYQGLMDAYNTKQSGISQLMGGILTNALGKK